MIKLSAVIITYNEERNIARCIESVKGFADEILVVDSNSTDNTVPIAESYNARIVSHAFLGYADQRILTDNSAENDWILMLDADESVSEELAKSIIAIKNDPGAIAYKFARLNKYNGKWIKHGTWYPDRKIRLYNRTKGTWKGGNVHEYWEAYRSDAEIPIIKGDLLHDSFAGITDHINKVNKYSDIAARDAIEKGKTTTSFRIWAAPKWTFITSYIIRMGFLDGYEGYLIAKISAFGTFAKYSKIRQYSRESKV